MNFVNVIMATVDDATLALALSALEAWSEGRLSAVASIESGQLIEQENSECTLAQAGREAIWELVTAVRPAERFLREVSLPR